MDESFTLLQFTLQLSGNWINCNMNCHSITIIIYLSISELQYGNSKHAKNKLCESLSYKSICILKLISSD